MSYPSSGPVTLRINLADSDMIKPLKSGAIESSLVKLDFAGPKVAHDGFKPMVRDGAFDGGELAVATYLQAHEYRKPYVLLPAVVVGRFQHHCLAYNVSKGALGPKDLEGRTLAVRSYAQTTGMWVRGILKHEYGVDIDTIKWLVADEAHLAEYRDPANVSLMPKGHRKIAEMLLDGEVVGALLGNDMPKGDDRIRTVIPDPHEAAKEWYAKHRIIPINHVFVVKSELSRQRPDVVRELYRMLKASKEKAGLANSDVDTLPFGYERLLGSLKEAIEYSYEQNIISKRIAVGDLYDDVTRLMQT